LSAKHPEIVATSPDLQDSVHMFDMEKSADAKAKQILWALTSPKDRRIGCGGEIPGLGYEGLIPFFFCGATFDNFLLEPRMSCSMRRPFGSFLIAVGHAFRLRRGPGRKKSNGHCHARRD